MLAEEFGYQVTARLASELTPAVRLEVSTELEATKKWAQTRSGGIGAAFLTAALAAIAIFGGKLSSFLFACAFAILMLFLHHGISKDKERGLSAIRQAADAALSSPWQAWPCRVEEGTKMGPKQLVLLGPDGTAARTFLSPMPDEVWIGMRDGRGLVWFAGDMRFGGIAALPGGSPLWWAHTPQENTMPTPSSARQQRIEEELTRQAVGYVFSEWL